ncbi:MAG: 2-dehydro-3-deoxy-6-phosphogalactonate aldolase [Gammaproteobacteria bacterium]|nr:2-dehydro-3-deoxy-6-phosphogalactonate aldolase [Gammaproteobacteria bacterium]
MSEKLDFWLAEMPAVAILRGVHPEEVVDIAMAIYEAGIGIIEVPLNSPDPLQSIRKLSDALGEQCVVGCGTLVDEALVDGVAESGAQIAVTPNTDQAIIQKAIAAGLIPIPGWATPSEAFAAYAAGARYLKLFPAASYGPSHVSAVRAVLPSDARVLAVGGVGASNAGEWFAAGVDGLGIGSELYKPGQSAAETGQRAAMIVKAIKAAR